MALAESSATKIRIAQRMEQLGIREEDLQEKFARASGPGGQHVNKVSTAVTVVHLPTGLRATAQESRSQFTNRQLARLRLLDLVEQRRAARRQEIRSEQSRRRRQNPRRSKAAKQKMLQQKRRRSEIKKLRRSPA